MTEIRWVSIDRPHLEIGPDDVAVCDCFEMTGSPKPECNDCRGWGLIHGYDSNGLGLPVRAEERE